MSWIVVGWGKHGENAVMLYNPDTNKFLKWNGHTAQYEPYVFESNKGAE